MESVYRTMAKIATIIPSEQNYCLGKYHVREGITRVNGCEIYVESGCLLVDQVEESV